MFRKNLNIFKSSILEASNFFNIVEKNEPRSFVVFRFFHSYDWINKIREFRNPMEMKLQDSFCDTCQIFSTISRNSNPLNICMTNPMHFQHVRNARVSGSDVKVGNIIERKGGMYQINKLQHTQHGRGGATIQVELRDIHSGNKTTDKLRTSERIEVVFVTEKDYSFLYKDGATIVLMDQTFDQISVSESIFGDSAIFLTDGMEVKVKLLNDQPLLASVPPRVTCQVAEADSSFKGQTVAAVYKKCKLENGLVVQVPIFVNGGDKIIVNSSDLTYITRAGKND